MTKGRRVAVAVLLLVAVAAGIAAIPLVSYWRNYRFWSTPQGRAGDPPVFVTIEEGTHANTVAQALEKAGVVRPAAEFVKVARWKHREKDLFPGEYRFDRPISPRRVLEILGRNGPDVVRVTVPEGLSASEVAALVARAGVSPEAQLLAAFRDPAPVRDLDPAATDLEGYLYPGTYRMSKDLPAGRVARALVHAFEKRFVAPSKERLARAGRSLHDVVTLASLVEKETARPEERARIAGVFVARLARGMRLQCDPTVIFASRRTGHFTGTIHRSDLERDDPYNTYVRTGLPPGPIASPGQASLDAALEPDRGDSLYFMSRGDGSHVFSATLDAHNNAVRKYRNPS